METRVEKPRRHKWIAAALALIMTMTVFLTALPPLSVGAASNLKNVIFMFNDIVLFYSDPSNDENVIMSGESTVNSWNGKSASAASNQTPEGEKLTFSAGVPTYLKFSAEIDSEQPEQVVFEVYALSGTERGNKLGECTSDPAIANGYKWSALTETNETIIIVPRVPAAKHTVTLPPNTKDYMFKAVNGTEVEDGQNFQFYLYERSDMGEHEVNFTILESFVASYAVERDESLSSGGTPKNYKTGIGYVVKNVREDITIDFSATDEKFTPTLDAQGCPGFKGSTVVKETSITSGTNYPFNITIKPGYGTPTVTVRRGESGTEETLVATGEGGNSATGTIYYYTVQNVTTNITIKVTGEPIAQYAVTWETSDSFKFTKKTKGESETEDGWDSVEYGTKVKFQIEMTPGYDPNQVVVLVNGVEASKDAENYYSFILTQDVSVSVRAGTAQKLKYNLGLHGQTGYSATASSTSVEHGQNFTFTITLSEGYTLSNTAKNSIDVKIGLTPYPGCTITDLENGRYQITVTNVTNAGEVTIDAGQIEKAKFSITWPTETDGYKIVGDKESSVEYNTQIIFQVNIQDYYNATGFTVFANGERLLPSSSGNYTYTVKGETTITVENVTKKNYSVQVLPGEGYTTQSTGTVQEGGKFTFTITLRDGYEISDKISVAIGERTYDNISPVRISNTNEYTVTVEDVTGFVATSEQLQASVTDGITLKKFEAQDKDTQYSSEETNENHHYTLKFTGGGTVAYGSSVSFTVEARSGWKITGVTIVDKEGYNIPSMTLTEAENGSYRVTSVTQEFYVKVETKEIDINITWTHKGDANVRNRYTINDIDLFKKNEVTGEWYIVLPDTTPNRTGFKFTGWQVTGAELVSEPMAVASEGQVKYKVVAGEDMNITIDGQWDYSDDLFTLGLSSSQAEGKIIWTTTISMVGGVAPEDETEFETKLAGWKDFKIVGYGVVYSNKFFTQEDVKATVSSTENEVKASPINQTGAYLYFYKAEQVDVWNLNNNNYTQKFGVSGGGNDRWCMSFLRIEIDGNTMTFYSSVEHATING